MKFNKVMILLIFMLFICAFSGCTSAYKMEFKDDAMTIVVGQTVEPNVVIRPSDTEYTLFSSNNTILSVEGNSIKGLKSGIVTLTASSGNKSCTMTVYVLDENDVHSEQELTFHEISVINYYIINYQLLGLENSLYSSMNKYYGTDISNSFPTANGYAITWYVDETCHTAVPSRIITTGGITNYYGVATERDNRVLMDSNHYVTGLEYPNLEHGYLILPSSYNGEEIRGIADKAFYQDTTLKTVIIPENYTYIGDFAFAGCTSLEKVEVVNIEDSRLTTIGKFAFGCSYTLEIAEEEEEEESSSVDDLTTADILKLLLGLTDVQDFFGVVEETEEGEPTLSVNEDFCTKLTEFVLPDSINNIGEYAFYNCSALAIDGLPTSLTEVMYGAFMGSGINNIDFSNVKKIDAYAFYNCFDLDTVTGTQNVEICGGYAFRKSKLYNDQKKDNLVYAGTILVDCSPSISGFGVEGRITLKGNTSLLADYALNAEKLTDVTVYFTNNNVKIGWKTFTVQGYKDENEEFPYFYDHLYLVVPEESLQTYIANNPYYTEGIYEGQKEHFCTRQNIVISDENGVNFGTHTVLKVSPHKQGSYYVYDKFTVAKLENGNKHSPTEIDISLLPNGNNITRVNSFAFVNIGRLQVLRLAGAQEIANFAVSNCNNLGEIDLSETPGIVTLETSNAFQFSTLKHGDGIAGSDYRCYIVLPKQDYALYKQNWSTTHKTASEQVRYYVEVSLHAVDYLVENLGTKKVLAPSEASSIDCGIEGYTATWYSDSACQTEATTITQDCTLYAVLTQK